MSLWNNLDLLGLLDLLRRDLPRPLDVPNLIHFKSRRSYARYGRAVAPLLGLVGGRIRWSGRHTQSLLGESRAEELLIVRYPSHRHFLALALNPYYILVCNPLRLRGVERFEASFTTPVLETPRLSRAPRLVVAHFNSDTPEATRQTLEASLAPASLVYHSRETSPITLLKRPSRKDPNPLHYKHMACFRLEAHAPLPDLDALDPAELSLQLYQRVSPRDMLTG